MTHHTRLDSSGRVISPSQRPLPDNKQQSQQTAITRRYQNPQSQQARDRRPTPKGKPTLEADPTEHNTTVWTDSGQRSKNQTLYCVYQWLHGNRSDCHHVSKQLPTVWPNSMELFGADSLARHLPQWGYDSSVGAVDKTYLIELVRDMQPFGTKETESTTTEISSQNVTLKYERNYTLQVLNEITTLMN